jgi:hypothetical protein
MLNNQQTDVLEIMDMTQSVLVPCVIEARRARSCLAMLSPNLVNIKVSPIMIIAHKYPPIILLVTENAKRDLVFIVWSATVQAESGRK